MRLMKIKTSHFTTIICLLLYSIAIILLVGCNEDAQIIQDHHPDGEQIVIKWMVYGEAYKDSNRVFETFNDQLRLFYPDTVVEFEVVEKDKYKAEWDMKMATSEPLDIAWIGQDLFNYTNEVKKGSFMAIDYLLATYGENLLGTIPQNLWDLQIRDGNTFAIPIKGALYRKAYGIVTKSFYLDASGQQEAIEQAFQISPYTDSQCYEAIEKYLEYVKENEDFGTGVSHKTMKALANRGLEGVYGMDSPFVVKIFDEEIKVYNKYQLDLYKTYFAAMQSWYAAGYIRADIAKVINPTSEDGKESGSILFVDEYGEEGIIGGSIKTEYESVRIPVDDYRYIAYDSCPNVLVIPKSSENPQRAMQIITLLFSEEGKDLYRLLVNGIENEHYILYEENNIARMRNNDQSLLYALSPYTIGNTFMNYELIKGQYERVTTYNNQSIESKLIGFNLDTRMIVAELTKMDLVVAEYSDLLSQGSLENWEETYNTLLLKMEEAGSSKIIEELQRQIDEFLLIGP